jgi:hypothetical protein
VFAEVALTAEQRPESAHYGLHPALLDTALRALALTMTDETAPQDTARPPLPESWHQVALYAEGASTLRVRLTWAGTDTVAVDAADDTGLPVAAIGAIQFRPASTARCCGCAGPGRRARTPRTNPVGRSSAPIRSAPGRP